MVVVRSDSGVSDRAPARSRDQVTVGELIEMLTTYPSNEPVSVVGDGWTVIGTSEARGRVTIHTKDTSGNGV